MTVEVIVVGADGVFAEEVAEFFYCLRGLEAGVAIEVDHTFSMSFTLA